MRKEKPRGLPKLVNDGTITTFEKTFLNMKLPEPKPENVYDDMNFEQDWD